MSRTTTERQAVRDSHPDSWIPVQEGDSIRGKVTDVTEAWSDQRNNGSFYPLLTIKAIEAPGYDLTGGRKELKVHAFGAVLHNEVMRHRPEVGETVTITYKGTGEAKKRGHNPPELYAVRVDGRTDQAQRAYDRIEREDSGTRRRSSGSQAAPEPDVPIEPVQQTLDESGDDIPF